MFSWFRDWFSDLPPLLRYGVSVTLLLISTGLWFAGYIWPWGWGAGVILLFFSGPSDSEKKGYHF